MDLSLSHGITQDKVIESSDTALNYCETLFIMISSKNPIMEKHLWSFLGAGEVLNALFSSYCLCRHSKTKWETEWHVENLTHRVNKMEKCFP